MARKVLNGLDLTGQRISNVGDPSAATDAANKQYVDNTAAGLDWKENVRAASTANMTVASGVINGATMDGVTLATGDRVLLKNQTTASENGIYLVAATGAATRATDADTSADIKNMVVRVSEGTVNADTMWQLVTDNVTLGTTALTYTQFGGGTSYTADGQGITLTGNQFSLVMDGTTLQKSASGIRVGSGAAGNGLTEALGVLSVGAGTGITVAADTVAVDTSVVVRKYAANCAATTNPQTFTHSLATSDVDVVVKEVATNAIVMADVTVTDANNVSVNFGAAPTAGQYRVAIFG